MDFRSLKRRELQALCKKHKIPANLSNLEMGKRLADFFKEKGQVNEQEKNVSEIESIDVVRDRQVKKVRFSPEHELIEFTRSHGIKQRHRRSFVSVKESASSVEHDDIGHMDSKCVNGNGRVTRTRGSTLMQEQQVNDKKRGRKGVKCNEQKNNGSAVESVNKDKLGEGNIETSSRVLRSRRHKLADDVENAQKVGKPEDKMGNGKSFDDAGDEKPIEENVEGPGRLTRSRRQKLSGASGKNTVIVESVEIDDGRVVTRCSSRKRGFMAGCEDMKTEGKNEDEILENRKISEAQNMIEPEILLRRSRRNVDKVGASVGEVHTAEPINPEVQRSKRRESVIAPHENARNSELTAETKKTKQPRSSAPQLVIAGRVSKNEKKVPQPSEVMRRSRRKVVEICETENHLSGGYPMENGSSAVEKNMGRSRRIATVSNSVGIRDDTSKCSVFPQKNEVRKRKKGPRLEEGAVKTTKTRSRKLPVKGGRNEKTVSILESQPCLPDGADSTRDSGSRGETKNENMTSHLSQMSGRRTRIGKKCVSSVGCAKNSHVEISDGNKSANSKDSGKQISASNIKDNAEKLDSLECDVIIEKTATSVERNQSEAQFSSQIKGSSCLNMTSGQMLQEGSIVSRNEGYAEICPSTDTVLLRNQTDVNSCLEVIEAEADKHTTPGSVVVDHAGEVEGVYVKKKLEPFGNGEMNVISPPIAYLEDNKQHIDASNRSYKSNNEDGSSKAGEVGPSDSCVSGRCIDNIQSKLAIQVKEPSSSKSRSIESNNAETEKGGCLQGNLTAEIEDDEFSVSHLFGSEISAMINLQDRGIDSGEFSARESDERDINKESSVVFPMHTCELPNICLQRNIEADHTAKTDDGGFPNSHNRKCDEDKEFIVSDILGVERRDTILPQDGDIIYDEMSIEDSDDKGLENELSGCEAKADQIAEGDEPRVCKDNQSEPAGNNDGGCLENKYERDDDGEFGLSSLFDSGKNVRDTPQARGIMSVEQAVFDEVPAASTTINEVKINSGSLSIKEIGPQPISSSVPRDSRQIISETCEIIDKEADCALVLEKSVCSFGNNICGDEMLVLEKRACDRNPEIVNPPDVHTKEYIPEREERLEGLPVVPTAINKINEDDACVANDGTASKLLAESVCELEFHHAENIVHQSENLHENHTISDVGEKQSDVVSRQRWAEIKLANLFETTPTGSWDTAPQGTERPNIMLCTNKYDAKSGDRLTNGEKEMEGERGSESLNTTYENAFLPTEVSDFDRGFGVDSEDNQLQLLFATPMKIECPSLVDKTCSRRKRLDEADVSSTECVYTTEEDAVAQSIQDDKTRVAETQLEHSFCFGSSSGDVGFVNTSTVFLSDATEQPLIEDTSFLYEEATGNRCQLTEINTLCLSGPPKNLDKLEGGKEMLSCSDLSENGSNTINVCPQSMRKTAQSNGAQFESPNVNNQKSNLLENSLQATAGFEDSILSKRLCGTFKDLASVEAANVGSYNGTSPSFITKASDEDDEVTEKKPETVDDENDVPYEARNDNFRPSDHTSEKPHIKTEVDSLRSPSVSNNSLELDSTCKETGTITQNKDDVLSAAEQGCSVSGAKVNVFSSLAMHQLLGDDENGDCDKLEARMPILNLGCDIEEKDKEDEKNSISMEVQLSSSEFQLEEGENSNTENRNVSHAQNGDIEKSGVGTPPLNREADDVKNDKEVEKSPAAEAVQLEEQSVCSKNGASPSTCNELLKESDVIDTINEYIGSELAWINEALCEDGSHKDESFETGSKELEEAIRVNVHVGGYSADELAVEKEGEEQTKDLSLKESCSRKEMVENFPAIVPLGGNSGSDINNEMSPLKVEIESTKNLRTILIHGTPSKVPKTADMKENAPAHKNSVLGDLTEARPAKRKALQDVNWK